MKSFLVTDFGTAYTRTVLIDVVEGQYRLMASSLSRTSAALPEGDVMLGLRRNVAELQTRIGRNLLDDRAEYGLLTPGRPDGSGFDEFIATASSAGRPLRAVLVALMDDFSLLSARRALTGTYVEVVATLTLIDIATEEERINRILHDRPDVIFIAGGTNEGNENNVRDLIRLVETAVKLLKHELQVQRPMVFYAGNAALSQYVEERLSDDCLVYTADNVRPEIGVEDVESAKLRLAQVFNFFIARQPGGFSDLARVGEIGIIPTAQSAMRLVRYLDSLDHQNGTLHLDIGSSSSTLLSSLNGHTTANIRSNLGLGVNIREALNSIDYRDVERWLPFPLSYDDFEEWVYNKWLAPLTYPHTLHDTFIEQATAREITRLLIDETLDTEGEVWGDYDYTLPHFNPIIIGGAVFTGGVPPRLAAMLALDALQPVGRFDLWLDPYNLSSALGAISFREPVAVVQVVDSGGFERLGTVYAPVGRISSRAALGRMRVKLSLPDGEIIEKNIAAGEIWSPNIPAGLPVEVNIRLSRGLSINGKRRINESQITGTAGLVFDMRGRPIQFPSGKRRRALVAAWYTAMTGIYVDQILSDEDAYERGDAMLAVESAREITADDYPNYLRLPEKEANTDFQTLFKGAMLTDGVNFPNPDQLDQAQGEVDDLLKELQKR